MADKYKGSSRLVSSDYLYKVLKLEDDRVKSKLKDELYEDKTRTVIDTPENYVRCTSSDPNAILVDSSNIDAIKAFIEDITDGEYVQHVDEVLHEEQYTDTVYRLKDDSYSAQEIDKKLIEIASGGLQPWELSEYQDYIDNLVVTAAGFVETTP